MEVKKARTMTSSQEKREKSSINKLINSSAKMSHAPAIKATDPHFSMRRMRNFPSLQISGEMPSAMCTWVESPNASNLPAVGSGKGFHGSQTMPLPAVRCSAGFGDSGFIGAIEEIRLVLFWFSGNDRKASGV